MAIALDEIIAGRAPGEHSQAAHHRFIITIFGVYGRPAGRALKVSTVVGLMSVLGYEPASVRSSISRLKKKGVLVPQAVDGAVGYALAEELEPHMIIGDERIFSPRSQGANEPWLMVSYSVPEAQRKNRQIIRTGLTRLGFGTVVPGLSIAPAHLRAEVMEYMTKHGVTEYVDYFASEPIGPGGMRQRVAQWWNLESLESHYREFVDLYEHEVAKWSTHTSTDLVSLRAAFQLYIPLLTHWRRLPYLDPGLPIEFLPDGWMGIRARRAFTELHRSIAPLAAAYVRREMA
ncbi:PaaX family transcriptional regulator [Arthrobacter mangrovi]|uniref:PaaX family transcriptional regulator n=1 Tax=Arthrobacter mangrovi TaxID=2966350 RepID=A0ABQ5MYR9_9MICC|nr:PaaX family transcriptional regulator C-terminal domain-containing protein [Arthrobacter mangrovi]GLB69127.1 PaaX family transcriptional regulator [Arthrobacter mangrovi]